MNYPKRKSNRLPQYDYSQPNMYFITICTHEHKKLFWQNVGATIGRPPCVELSEYGKVVQAAIEEIPQHYPAFRLEHYVVMPNHVHLLLQIVPGADGRPMVAPTISTVVAQFKGTVSKQLGSAIWQKSFHDRVVRNETEYQKIWEYIEYNPHYWTQDCFYIP